MIHSVDSLLDLENPSRRKFLRSTVLGVVAMSVARVLPAFPLTRAASSTTAPTFLTSTRFRTLQAVCARIIPEGDDMPGASEVNVAGRLDQYLSKVDPPVAEQIGLLLDIVEFSPPVFDLKWGRFTSFKESEQDEILASWENSRLDFRRTGFLALKRLSLSAYYGQEETWKAIGYDGPIV